MKTILFVIVLSIIYSCSSDSKVKLIDESKKELLIPKGTNDINDQVVGCWQTKGEEMGSGRTPVSTKLFNRVNFYSDGTMDDMSFTETGLSKTDPLVYKRTYRIDGGTIYMNENGRDLPPHNISLNGNSMNLMNETYYKCDCN